jgi:hypothetical protein
VSWSIVCPPEHRQLFSPDGLINLLCSSGFDLSRLITRGTNPVELRNHFRRQRSGEKPTCSGHERVDAGYAVLARAETSRLLDFAIEVSNFLLVRTNLGDYMKAWATKAELPRPARGQS